jgi:hypothetical protein
MRLRRFISLLIVPGLVGAQVRPDSQRVGSSLRVLELIQGFQMASSPELASAINALLVDDGAHSASTPT